MSIEDLSKLLSAAAEILNDDDINRPYCVNEFANNLSENGARFVEEIITKKKTLTKKK